MSVRANPPQVPKLSGEYDTYYEEQHRVWMIFAGLLVILLGAVNVVDGIAAIGHAHFDTAGARYIVGDLKTWGWVVLCLGAAQLVIGLGIFVKNQFARWAGVVILGLDAIAQLMMMPAYPFWALCIFAIDVLAIFGLVVHGQRSAAS